MDTLTQPLRDEHKELIPHIENILRVADSIPDMPLEQIQDGVEEVYDFLAYHLLPHAQAEEAALYPAVQQALGSPNATRTMSHDHIEVGRYIEELAVLRREISPRQFKPLLRVLYGVYALVKVHFAKEEEVYLPILEDRLSTEQAKELFEAMEKAAGEAKLALHTN
ncbi:MAG TPA: hemerythrin domain-containing protein [Anaerolineales bacterium]|nr:hemerythrin domain-containing protein [Anaerolineales bacterium]